LLKAERSNQVIRIQKDQVITGRFFHSDIPAGTGTLWFPITLKYFYPVILGSIMLQFFPAVIGAAIVYNNPLPMGICLIENTFRRFMYYISTVIRRSNYGNDWTHLLKDNSQKLFLNNLFKPARISE
jgi:hypothetical protein